MTSFVLAVLFAASLGGAAAEPADCQAQLKRQDEHCQALAEKLAAACPTGTNIKETAQCRDLSSQIANTCTRKPCAPPPRKRDKAKAKAKSKATAKSAAKPAAKSAAKPAAKSAAKPAAKSAGMGGDAKGAPAKKPSTGK